MKKSTILRAWKDPMFRMTLSEEQRAKLPPNPAGVASVDDLDLAGINGGGTQLCPTTLYTTCCGAGESCY